MSRTIPPSAMTARAWTVAAVPLPILLPLALWYAHRACQEVADWSADEQWRRRLIDRPLIFNIVVWSAVLGTTAVLMVILSALGVPPV